MKLRFLSVACALLVTAGCASAQIVAFNFWSNNTPTAPATFNAGSVDTNLATTTGLNLLTRGAGAVANSANNSFRTAGFGNNGISTSNTDYFQFVVQAQTGYTLSLASIAANFAGTTSFAASPGVSMQWAYSLNGTNFTLIGSPQSVIGSGTSATFTFSSVDALQNVNSNTAVTLRFYASGQTTTGGWGFNSSTSSTNGLALNGTVAAVSPVPEPSTYAALAGALALAGVIIHRRRRTA